MLAFCCTVWALSGSGAWAIACQAQWLQHAGLGAPRHVGSDFLDQGFNPHPLHWKAGF